MVFMLDSVFISGKCLLISFSHVFINILDATIRQGPLLGMLLRQNERDARFARTHGPPEVPGKNSYFEFLFIYYLTILF